MENSRPNSRPARFVAPPLDRAALLVEFESALASGVTPLELFVAEREKTAAARAEAVQRRWELREAREAFSEALGLLEAEIARRRKESP